MKKVLLGAVVLGGLALTSCKKDYKCEVSTTVQGETITASSEHKDVSNSDAKDLEKSCEDGGGTWSEM